MRNEADWITLDYLEIFCQNNRLIVGCRGIDNELWISPSGSHPHDLSGEEIRELLRNCTSFEVRDLPADDEDDEEGPSLESAYLSRDEMQNRLRRLLN